VTYICEELSSSTKDLSFSKIFIRSLAPRPNPVLVTSRWLNRVQYFYLPQNKIRQEVDNCILRWLNILECCNSSSTTIKKRLRNLTWKYSKSKKKSIWAKMTPDFQLKGTSLCRGNFEQEILSKLHPCRCQKAQQTAKF
jgi:hypothetical protein